MIIVIPTRGRVSQPAGAAFHAAGFEVDYVHTKGEIADIDLKGWSTAAKGIAGKRAAIVKRYGSQRILMVDDDIKFRVRHMESTKFTRCEPGDLHRMVQTLDRALNYTPMAGIAEQYMATLKPKGMSRHGLIRQVFALHLGWWQPKFTCATGEDVEASLRLIQAGHAPIILHEWTHDDVRYSDGGCSIWRTPEVEKESELELHRLFPDLTTVVPAPKKISGQRLKIPWRRATPKAEVPDIYPEIW